jgi:hypothetical protein
MLPPQQSEFHSNGGQVYKHWNVFFKDIVRVSIDIVDKENRITNKDFERALGQETDIKTLIFVLKVHYMVSEGKLKDEQDLAGFRVGRRDIKAKTKDFRIIKRILKTLQQRLK